MKTIIIILLTALLGLVHGARTIDLYYSEDGKTIQSIQGYFINKDLTIVEEGDISWLVVVGQRIGPNGYMVKRSKLTLGPLGKTDAVFIEMSENFLGFGHGRRYERSLDFNEIAYIIPDPKAFEPFHVKLLDGDEGELFVAGDYTESPGAKKIQGKEVNDLFIIKLKYDIPRSQRTPNTRPKQYGIRAKVISFSEQGLRKALRRLRF
jgi:hypothetical protein